MLKKIISILLALVFILGLISCTKTDKKPDTLPPVTTVGLPQGEKLSTSYESDGFAVNIYETYSEIISSLEKRNVEIVSDLPEEPFEFGDFTVQFFNTETPQELAGKGENASSVGVKITKGERVAFLAADITKACGLEQILGDKIGKVDVLKIGHHGYYGSSSADFLEKLSPEIAVVTNQLGKIYPNVKWNLTMKAKIPVYATFDNDGIICSFTDNGEIILIDNIL